MSSTFHGMVPMWAPALAYFFALLLFFLLLSVMLSLTFLDEQIGWAFLAGMSAIGAANLAFSYQLALNSVPTSSAEI